MENGSRPGWLERYGIYGLAVVSACILFFRLGDYPLQMQWEPNYGQVVREMVWGEGDILTPTSMVGNDEGAAAGTFWSKPIMIFWLAWPFYALFGDSEWCARIPIALLGLVGVLFTAWFMGRLYNRRTGLIAGLLLITTPVYVLISRAFMVDLPFVVFLWMATGFLLLAEHEGRAGWYWLFYVFLGLSALAKGATPVMIIGMALMLYCLVSGDWRLLVRMRPVRGALIFLAVAAPWYSYMTIKYGLPYLKKFFWDHHVERSLGKLDKPNDTFEMFVLYFSIGLLPWLVFLPQALVSVIPWASREGDRRGPGLFFVVVLMFVFTFFSAISTKFPHYIFPAVPFALMIVAVYLDRLLAADARRELPRIALLAALAALLITAPDLLDQKNYRTLFYFITTERLQDWHANVADPVPFFSVVFALVGALLGVALLLRRFNGLMLGLLAALSVAYTFHITLAMVPDLAEMFSARSMLRTYLGLRSGPEEPIAEFTQTWKSRSIKYYIPFEELRGTYNYRTYRLSNSLDSVRRFHDRNRDRRVFFIVEEKQKHFKRLNALWQEVTGGEQLVKIADDGVPGEPYRPEFWLVSNRDSDGRATRVAPEELQRRLARFVGREPPAPRQPASILFGRGEIELVGFEPLPAEVKPGDDISVTLHFRSHQKTAVDYQVFVHAERDRTFRLRGDHMPVDGQYPVSRWEPGEYITDVFLLDVPPHTPEGPLDVSIGLFNGDYRLPVADSPLRDAENRVRLGTVTVLPGT